MSKIAKTLGENLLLRRAEHARKRMQSLTTSQIDDRLNLIECPVGLRDEIVDRLIELDRRREGQ